LKPLSVNSSMLVSWMNSIYQRIKS